MLQTQDEDWNGLLLPLITSCEQRSKLSVYIKNYILYSCKTTIFSMYRCMLHERVFQYNKYTYLVHMINAVVCI